MSCFDVDPVPQPVRVSASADLGQCSFTEKGTKASRGHGREGNKGVYD